MPKLAAAALLGLLTGLLIGLAASGVVASVVSALLAMAAGLAALTGVKNPFLGKEDAAQSRGADHDSAVAAFALCAILGLGAGLWTRTHNLLSPSPAEIAAQWRAAGLSEQTAARVAVLSLTGAGFTEKGGISAGDAAGPASSLLFSGGEIDDCGLADPEPAPNADEARNTWSRAAAPWPKLAAALPEAPKTTLGAVWGALCEE